MNWWIRATEEFAKRDSWITLQDLQYSDPSTVGLYQQPSSLPSRRVKWTLATQRNELYASWLSFRTKLLTSPRPLSHELATCVQYSGASREYLVADIPGTCFVPVNGTACGRIDDKIPTV